MDRETGAPVEYFMINCAHPTHFESALQAGEPWTKRIHGVRANASTKSHAELDESDDARRRRSRDLGRRYRASGARSRRCGCSAAAAAPITVTSQAICEACLPPAGS